MRLRLALRTPVELTSLAAFRLLFGLVMFVSTLRFVAKGWVDVQILGPSYHFTYDGFEWIRPWTGWGMYGLFGLLLVAALCLSLGFCTRSAAFAFGFGFTYVELIDRATYLNHYYLVSLLALMLGLLPAGAALSLDARLWPRRARDTMPAFGLYALRCQVAVVYVFAGLAKLNGDWLLRAQPLRIWLSANSGLPWIGELLAQPATAYFASWAGALFDLVIVPCLLCARTRTASYALLVAFHLSTGFLLPIGAFPWIMIVAATVLLPPSWPRRLLRQRRASLPARLAEVWEAPRGLAPVLALHCALQIAVPLYRQLAYRDSAWTRRGFDFAWRVMVAEKAGQVRLEARDRASGERWNLAPARFLTHAQEHALGQDPELIRQLARHVAAHFGRRGRAVSVYADAVATLNGRPLARLIDPDVDLTTQAPERWILPMPN